MTDRPDAAPISPDYEPFPPYPIAFPTYREGYGPVEGTYADYVGGPAYAPFPAGRQGGGAAAGPPLRVTQIGRAHV